MNHTIIRDVREKRPLIHHLTNQVVMNFSANGLLAFGGSPIMAKALEEADEMAAISDGVLLNIGTLQKGEVRAMIKAGRTANEHGIPVVFDPVGIAATSFRASAVEEILGEVKPTVIKGNAGELAHLASIPWKTKGVDSIDDGHAEEIAEKVHEDFRTAVVVTGKTDIICTSDGLKANHSGHPILSQVTGTGCLLGSILAACLATKGDIHDQLYSGAHFYGLAAEQAAALDSVKGPGTFLPHFLDALSFDPEQMERSISYGN